MPSGALPASEVQILDTEWDEWLERHPEGHFQQSSGWARAKQVDGWSPLRRVVYDQGELVGGFQILTRRTPLGPIGYCYKGPVSPPDNPAEQRTVVGWLTRTARESRLLALIVQPPDDSRIPDGAWAGHGWLPNRLIGVIGATLIVDLTPGLEAVHRGLSRTARHEIRTAGAHGVHVRAGTAAELPLFFDLMAASCARQRTKPNPGHAASMQAIWAAFPEDRVRLFLAECEGQTVAGGICIAFGRRVVFWKRGWSGDFADACPNQAITYAAMRWACERGYFMFDFDALDRGIAQNLLAGRPLTDTQRRTRDAANLKFAHSPRLLPSSWVYVPSRLGRFGTRVAGSLRARLRGEPE